MGGNFRPCCCRLFPHVASDQSSNCACCLLTSFWVKAYTNLQKNNCHLVVALRHYPYPHVLYTAIALAVLPGWTGGEAEAAETCVSEFGHRNEVPFSIQVMRCLSVVKRGKRKPATRVAGLRQVAVDCRNFPNYWTDIPLYHCFTQDPLE